MTINISNITDTTPTLQFKGHQLRHIMIEGEPWFVAVDILKCLGLKTGTGMFYTRLDADEQTSSNRTALGLPAGKPMKLVNESGLYKLIMRSDKPEAKAFQDWVTKEVLPSIRKTGGYLLNEEARSTAHADTKEQMPLPEALQVVFAQLVQPLLAPLEAKIVYLEDYVKSMKPVEAVATWTDKTGTVWEIADMHFNHLENAYRMLKREREYGPVMDAMRAELTKRRAAKRMSPAKKAAAMNKRRA